MNVNGKCHCGQITYRAVADPESVRACHCTDCQTLSGSAYRVSVPTLSGTFELLTGQPKVYIKTAESGTKRAHAFCPDCGTPIYSAAVANTPPYSLRIGSLEQRADLPPRRQIWCNSAVPWSADLANVPQLPRQ